MGFQVLKRYLIATCMLFISSGFLIPSVSVLASPRQESRRHHDVMRTILRDLMVAYTTAPIASYLKLLVPEVAMVNAELDTITISGKTTNWNFSLFSHPPTRLHSLFVVLCMWRRSVKSVNFCIDIYSSGNTCLRSWYCIWVT